MSGLPDVASSVSIKHLGKPVALFADENLKEVFMGTITGIASGIGSKINSDTGEVDEFLTGTFDAERPDGAAIRSSKFFPADSYAEALFSQFEDAEGNKLKGINLTISIDVYAKRDKCKAGFTWVYRFNTELDKSTDPISLIKAQVAAKRQARLEAPKEIKAVEHHNKKEKAA